MAQWKIFYADGATFSDADGDVSSAPRWGMICCRSYTPGKVTTTYGTDFYTWDDVDGQMQARDRMGVVELALSMGLVLSIEPGAPTIFDTPAGRFDMEGLLFWLIDVKRIVLAGQTVPASQYKTIMDQAYSDDYGSNVV